MSTLLNDENQHINGFDIRIEDLLTWIPASDSFQNKKNKKAILKCISTEFKPGTLTAVVGPSGSGKTTLVNFLSGRQENSQMFLTSGSYFLNGHRLKSLDKVKHKIGYVLQEDIMEVRFTPRNTFEHYARLRGHENPSQSANLVIDKMRLKNCADTVVGDAFIRGLSGGEKKRTSIGIELLASPNLLFLDEPTTGLDSTTALDVITELVKLKTQGMTIICTIHQPSEEIMNLFDKVVMLVDGHIVYDDTPAKIQNRLNLLGLQKNKYETPIEFFMKIVDKQYIKQTLTVRKKVPSDEQVLETLNSRMNQMIDAQDAHNRLTRDNNIMEVSKNELVVEENVRPSFFFQMMCIFRFWFLDYYTISGGIHIKTGFIAFFLIALLLFTLKRLRSRLMYCRFYKIELVFFL